MKNDDNLASRLLEVHRRLSDHYGPLHWWPAETLFEVVVGAVLTQNTAWANVEKAIGNLKAAGLLHPPALRALPQDALAEYIRPSGTYSVKARRLHALLEWLGDDWEVRLAGPVEGVRAELLAVDGVGPETADAILLYAAGKPTFVVDAYTRRILQRLGIQPEEAGYEGYRRLFMAHLPADAALPTLPGESSTGQAGLYNEFHAQFVQLGKEHCRKRPRCAGCPLLEVCPTGQKSLAPTEAGAAVAHPE